MHSKTSISRSSDALGMPGPAKCMKLGSKVSPANPGKHYLQNPGHRHPTPNWAVSFGDQVVQQCKRIAYAVIVLSVLDPGSLQADRFNDITATALTIHQDQTFHGYAEHRILLENHASRATRRVTMVYPAFAWTSGNCISRLSRTVVLPPGARAVVPLLQPPLRAEGSSSLRVEVDGVAVGEIPLPGAARHMIGMYSHHPTAPLHTVILVSRSLDHAAAETVFQGRKAAFTAAMATGAPDSKYSTGMVPTTWMPDMSLAGPHWIELDYNPPLIAERIRIYQTGSGFAPKGTITLIAGSGTNIAVIQIPSNSPTPPVRGTAPKPSEFSFALTTEPVKTVRIEFDSVYNVGIDAVELVGPSGSGWAVAARASSDYSATAHSFSSGSDARYCLRAELPVSEWSEHWLAYTPYDAVLVSGADLRTMPAGVEEALWRYVECGGNLFVFGDAQVPEPWQSRASTNATNLIQYAPGFGRCVVIKDRPLANLDTATIATLQTAADTLARFWQTLPIDDTANASFRVADDVTVPVRGLVLIMLGFIIVIGPVNLVVLSRLKRRTWMLWTIPAISFLTSLFVFAYSLLSEGVTPTVRVESLTMLDQVNRRAATLGAIAFYCPLTPGDGLRFGYETELTPLVEHRPYQRSGTPREIDWTHGQHLQRGWVIARVPAHFFVRKSETRRERLQIEGGDGRLTVVNGLGAPVRALWLADAAGRVFSAGPIAAGARATLEPISTTTKVSGMFDLGDLLTKSSYGALVSVLTNNPIAHLRPGAYIAELEGNPFLENGLGPDAKTKAAPGAHVVYGILDSPGSIAPTAKATTQLEERVARSNLLGLEINSVSRAKNESP